MKRISNDQELYMPRVSVITPTYNGKLYISQALHLLRRIGQSTNIVPKGLGYRFKAADIPDTNLPSLMAYFQCIPSSMLIRRTVFERSGGWNEEIGRTMSVVGCTENSWTRISGVWLDGVLSLTGEWTDFWRLRRLGRNCLKATLTQHFVTWRERAIGS